MKRINILVALATVMALSLASWPALAIEVLEPSGSYRQYGFFGPLAIEQIYMYDGDRGDGGLNLENWEKIENATDAVVSVTFNDNAVELGDVQIKSSNTGTADNDYLQASFWLYDDDSDAQVSREFGQIVLTATDITSASLDSSLKINLQTGGNNAAPTTAATLTGTALTLGSGTDAILSGDLTVGNGTPDVTQNGEDAYVEGTFEVDGAARFDGAVTANSTITGAGDLTLDDGSGASPSITLTDATNETAVFSKADGANLSMTIAAADSLQVLTGNLSVGNGTPGTTLDGEDAYIEGGLEVDGAVKLDGAVTAASTVAIGGVLTNLVGIVDYNTTTSARAITAAESGKVFVCTAITGADEDVDKVTFTLPTAAAGLIYHFSDVDADAYNDLWVTAATGDTINGGTAGKSYKCTGDAVKQSITLVAISDAAWIVLNEVGTWANDNS